MISTHDVKSVMHMNELIRWFFTEAHLKEDNPFCRFETEALDALDNIDVDIDADERRRLKNLILERTDRIFESDLSWGQNIYSRENLRWVSFIAGYTLVVRENLEDHQPFHLCLEERIQTFCRIRFFHLWTLIAWTMILTGRILPRRSFIRKIKVSTFLTLTYLPFTTAANWPYGYDSFYERFFTAHSCPQPCDVIQKMANRWKHMIPFVF